MFWLKPVYAIILSVAIVAGVFFSYKNDSAISIENLGKRDYLIFGLVFVLIVLLVLTSGTGASISQYPDHLYRNGLFRILIDHDWPVRLTYDGTTKGLTYYLGFWLPAALIGKCTSYQFGLLCLQIWAVIGLFLTYIFICEKKQKVRLWYFIVFIFFGGADYIGFNLIGKLFEQAGNSIEWWNVKYNYPGVLTSIFWAYNQAIYAWVGFSMIMRQKNNKNLLYLWGCNLINSTFASVGMIPFVIYRAIKNVDEDKLTERIISAIKGCLSWQFVSGFIISLLSTIYLLSNTNVAETVVLDNSYNLLSSDLSFALNSAAQVKTAQFAAYPWTTGLYSYLWFILLEFGIHYMIIYQSQAHKTIYWLSLAVLLICPLINVGYWIDFCMRGSIPALFVLYYLVIDSFEDYYEKKNTLLLSLLVVMMLLSARTCLDTFAGVMSPTVNSLWDSTAITADAFDEAYIFKANNFFSSSDSFFYKYLAK